MLGRIGRQLLCGLNSIRLDENDYIRNKKGWHYVLELFKKVLTASCYAESSWKLIDTYDKEGLENAKRSWEHWLKTRIARFLWKRGVGIVSLKPFDLEKRQSGNDHPLLGFTMVGHKRLDNIQYCLETVITDRVKGDVIETGVWRGGAMMFAKAVLMKHGDLDRKIWCADSFEGLPRQFGKDIEIGADPDLSGSTYLAVDQKDVMSNFEMFGLLDQNVKFLKGWFHDTLPNAPIDTLSVVRLDGDLYESTMNALQNLYPKIASGGFLIIDDYQSWKGCKQAVDDYRKTHKIDIPIELIDQHGAFWRIT